MKHYTIPTKLIYPQSFKTLLQAALREGIFSFLAQGEPGTGKTSVGLAWAKQADWSVFAQANAWMDDSSSIQGVDLAGFVERDPARVYAAGFLLKALRLDNAHPLGRGVVVVDEWDKARPAADGLILAALQERVLVDSTGKVWGQYSPQTIFWITSNATREIHPALRRRCLVLDFPPLTGDALISRLRASGAGMNLAALLSRIGDEMRKAGSPIALSELERVSALAPKLTDQAGVKFLVSGLAISSRKYPAADIWSAVSRDKGGK